MDEDREAADAVSRPRMGSIRFSHSRRLLSLRSGATEWEWAILRWPSPWLGPEFLEQDQLLPREPLEPDPD